jgi:hypothetical protein
MSTATTTGRKKLVNKDKFVFNETDVMKQLPRSGRSSVQVI